MAAGDRETLYQILRWVVPQAQLLEKRAFVGYYLSFPDVSRASGLRSAAGAGTGAVAEQLRSMPKGGGGGHFTAEAGSKQQYRNAKLNVGL